MKPIGIILPFRDGGTGTRTEQLIKALTSWSKQTEGLSDVYVIIDDDESISHPTLLNAFGEVKWKVVPAGLTLMEKLNYHALEIAESHDYIQFLAHDIVLQTPWESRFIDFLEDVPYGMVYGNDFVHNGKLATHPCIKSDMIKAVGFYGCPAVEHNFFDNYWMTTAQSLGFCLYLSDVVMEHNHPIVGKAKPDAISNKIVSLLESDQKRFQEYMQINFLSDIAKIKGEKAPRKRKVVDCFPFYDEFMLLDVRFRELYDVVDKFIIVESTQTFTGISKPLYLTECLHERYPQYSDKVEIIVAPASDIDYPTAWDREKVQKNHINKNNLSHLNLEDDDLILIGDADEFPRRSTILSMLQSGVNAKGAFEHSFYYYKFNCKFDHAWYQSKFTTYKLFKDFWSTRYDEPDTLLINNAGWHFSYLKSPEKISEKIKAFSHQEWNSEEYTNPEKISARVRQGKDLFDREDHKLTVVPLDETFPAYVLENTDTLTEWIAK